MDIRSQKLVDLYTQCLENNYTDISDETHQLKVKVFAMDLGLKYRKIEDLFNEAKSAYVQNQFTLEIQAKEE